MQGARSSSNLTAFSMLKMKRVGHKGSRKSKSKRGSRERTAARKERKATQTLAIVLGESSVSKDHAMIQKTRVQGSSRVGPRLSEFFS